VNGGRRWRLVAVAIASGVAVLVAATAVLFLWPRTDGARPADAVVVLGGDGPRLAEGKALVRAGVARTLAVSVGSPYDACYRDHEPYTVICFRPDPLTTQGEARWIGATAKARAWHDVVVVVSAPQAVRAKLRIRRCYRGGLQVVAVHVGATTAVGDAVYEWGALLKALTLQRAC
jgi:hypothetical protein